MKVQRVQGGSPWPHGEVGRLTTVASFLSSVLYVQEVMSTSPCRAKSTYTHQHLPTWGNSCAAPVPTWDRAPAHAVIIHY